VFHESTPNTRQKLGQPRLLAGAAWTNHQLDDSKARRDQQSCRCRGRR
jgi:hypothetical protein